MKKIVEFNGLPGSGKTTIVNYIIDNNCQMVSFIDYIRSIPRFKKTIKIFTSIFKPKQIYLLICLLMFIYKSNHVNINNIKRVFDIYKLSVYYKGFKDNEDGVLLVDQGIIQQFISIFHDKLITDVLNIERILVVINRMFQNLHIVNIQCDIEENVRRIRSRLSNDSRIDLIDNQNMINDILHTQFLNLNIINSTMEKLSGKLYVINSNKSLKNIEEKFQRVIN